MVQSIENSIIKAADRCVMCGLCLPQCPTYTAQQHESDSPRGRISLIKALAETRLLPDNTCVSHLEGCLLCRRCEAICPANVPFEYLMDTTRQILFENQKTVRALPTWLAKLVTIRFLQNGLFFLLWIYYRSGIRKLLKGKRFWTSIELADWEAMLPSRLPRLNRPTGKIHRQTIGLFTGCLGRVLDSQTLLSSTRLIEALGCGVVIPENQLCCGALHQHAGDGSRGRALLNETTAAFNSYDTVVSCASGCGIQLAGQQTELASKHKDIHTFLLEHVHQLRFRPLDKTVALHIPCTMQYMSSNTDTIKPLLEKIPDLKIKLLPPGCCGGAGAYMLTHTDAANTLLDKLINIVETMNVDILLTANLGCALHFRRGLAKRGLSVETLHPAVLLERQMIQEDTS